MLVDQTFIDLSEKISAAPNVEQEPFKSQNAKEFIFPQLKETAAMKRSLTSADDDDKNDKLLIGKRAKAGIFFDSDN